MADLLPCSYRAWAQTCEIDCTVPERNEWQAVRRVNITTDDLRGGRFVAANCKERCEMVYRSDKMAVRNLCFSPLAFSPLAQKSPTAASV